MKVILPVSQRTFDEIAAEIRARDQADRVSTHYIDLADVVLQVNEAKRLVKDGDKQ